MTARDRQIITDVSLTIFKWGNLPAVTYTRQGTPSGGESRMGLLEVKTDQGVVGHAFLGSSYRSVDLDERALIEVVKPAVMGQNALDRDRLSRVLLSKARAVMYRPIGAMDVALWDIGGKVAG